jgi:hypothetical protein
MYEALKAALQCAMAQGSEPEPGVLTFAGESRTRLRLDEQGITYRNNLRTHQISWDQVRWLRDGGDGGNWVLCIVLHDGREIRADATSKRGGPREETLGAIRQAAARHAVPVVLTGVAAKRREPDKTWLYVDPGGKLGLREWTSTNWSWSPYLWVDPASIGHDAGTSPVRVWSPLSDHEQQRQWAAAAEQAKATAIMFAVLLGAEAIAAAVILAVFVYDLGQPQAGLRWAGGALVGLAFGACVNVGAWLEVRDHRKAARAAKRAAELARAQDSTPSPVDDGGGGLAARAPVTGQPPAADPAAGAGRISCRECGADSDRATRVCARCGAPLLPLSSP